MSFAPACAQHETGGFIAKLEIFSAAAQADEYGLLVIGVLAGVVSAFFYLRIAVSLLSAPEEGAAAEPGRRVDGWSGTVLLVTAAVVLVVGFAPGTFLHWARDATFLL